MLEKLMLSCPAAVAVYGAGGKTSLIYFLAMEAKKLGKRVIITTTTHLYKPEISKGIWDRLAYPYEVKWVSSKEELLAQDEKTILVYGAQDAYDKDKIQAVAQISLAELKTMADFIFVEADGAKGFPVKCPREWEPGFVEGIDLYLGMMGLSALGKPRKEVCFHYELQFTSGDELWTEEDFITLAKTSLTRAVRNKRFMIVLGQADQGSFPMEKLLPCGCEAVWRISHTEQIEECIWN